MQGPQWEAGLQGLDQYEQMVNTFVDQAKASSEGLLGAAGRTDGPSAA